MQNYEKFSNFASMEIHISDLNDLPRAAEQFIAAMGARKIFAFRGGMGAGKTTLISEICRQMGVEEGIGSPSFSIANEYHALPSGRVLYHFDFYRLESPSEALEIGVDEYFDSGSVCFIEWPEMIGDLIPEETVYVDIEEDALTGERIVTLPDA